MNAFFEHLHAISPVSVVIIAIGLMLACAMLVTRGTGLLKLPNVSAYIITGILLGPYCLNLVPMKVINGMDFVSDIALAFIAFAAGEFFKISSLRANGAKVVVITLLEALATAFLVFVLTYFVLHLGLAFSIILSALSWATAPASTLMTIRQTKAHGNFVDTLLSVIALDNVVSLLAFSIAISISVGAMGGSYSAVDIIKPFFLNGLMLASGALFGAFLNFLMSRHSTDNRLIISLSILFAQCGLGAAIGVSPLLGCMAIGMVYINMSGDERLFKQINYFAPPILLLFFVKSGINFRLSALLDSKSAIAGISLLTIGILYFFVRIIGKYLGSYLGCLFVKTDSSLRNLLGLALIPQAGVAIGLASLGARLLGGEAGASLQTIILASSILYEMVGPVCAKLSLYLSHSFGDESEKSDKSGEQKKQPNNVDQLKERLANIQKELEQKEYSRSAEELAFVQAAEELEEELNIYDLIARRPGRYRR